MSAKRLAFSCAFCAAAVMITACVAQGGLTLGWQFFESEAHLGQSGVVVLSDTDEVTWGDEANASAMADVDSELGETIAELQGWQSVDGDGVYTLDLTTTIDLRVNEDAGAINFSRGRTYFQLAVTVSDQPYRFDLDYEIDDATGPFVTQYDHFVNTYGDGPILYPRAEDYILLWGGLNYQITGFDFGGWEHLSTGAATDLTLVLTPVPEPATLVLLAAGGLVLIHRRRRPWWRTSRAIC